MGQKLGVLCPLLVELDPYLTNVTWTEAYLFTKWHLDPSSHLVRQRVGSMVHQLDFDLGLHRLVAAVDGGGSGD